MAVKTEVWKAVSGDDLFPNGPSVIAFVHGATSDYHVHFIEDRPAHQLNSLDVLNALNRLPRGHVRMLYEPGASARVIPYDLQIHSNIACTAALAPLRARYKEYLKQANVASHIMPCPTWPETEAISRYLKGFASSVTDAELTAFVDKIQDRYQRVGPFLRVLLSDDDIFDQYQKETNEYFE